MRTGLVAGRREVRVAGTAATDRFEQVFVVATADTDGRDRDALFGPARREAREPVVVDHAVVRVSVGKQHQARRRTSGRPRALLNPPQQAATEVG